MYLRSPSRAQSRPPREHGIRSPDARLPCGDGDGVRTDSRVALSDSRVAAACHDRRPDPTQPLGPRGE